MTGGEGGPRPAPARTPLALLLLAIVALLVGGALFYRADQRRARAAAESETAAIGRLKADEIARWRRDHLADASVLMDNRRLTSDVAAFLSSERQDLGFEPRTFLRSLQLHYGYDDVLLAGAEGRIRWSLSGTAGMHDVDSAASRRPSSQASWATEMPPCSKRS